MGFADFTGAQVIRYTRWRRDFDRKKRAALAKQPVRFVATEPTPEFVPVIKPVKVNARPRGSRRKSLRHQYWDRGDRLCYYCGCQMTLELGLKNMLTIEHKHPLGRGGKDVEANRAAACFACNNEKGDMTEAEYRAKKGLTNRSL